MINSSLFLTPTIRFVVKGNFYKNPVRVNWDPVITFLDDDSNSH